MCESTALALAGNLIFLLSMYCKKMTYYLFLKVFLAKVSLNTLRLRRLEAYQLGGKVARENLTEEVCQSFKMKSSGLVGGGI